MSLQPMIPAIAVAFLASVAAVILGILGDTGLTAHVSAAAFAALVAGIAFLINRPHWQIEKGDAAEAVHMTRRNTRLAALVAAANGPNVAFTPSANRDTKNAGTASQKAGFFTFDPIVGLCGAKPNQLPHSFNASEIACFALRKCFQTIVASARI
mgnify:CR=1 FL=1